MQGTKVQQARTATKSQQNLPVPPSIIAKVIQVAAEPASTAADLAALIGKDPTLTTQVLRAVNSAYYGLRRKIDTVQHSVAFTRGEGERISVSFNFMLSNYTEEFSPPRWSSR